LTARIARGPIPLDAGLVSATDGQRFLVAVPVGVDTRPPVTVIVNWAGLPAPM
jgi:hypothetical protein